MVAVLLTLANCAVFVALAAAVLSQRMVVGVVVTLAVGALQVSSYSLVRFDLAGLSVYPADLLLVSLLAATAVRVAMGRRVSWPLVALSALYLLNLIRGVVIYGALGSSTGSDYSPVNQAREFLYVFVVAAYFSTVDDPRGLFIALRRWWTFVAVCIGVMGVVFLARHGFGTYASTGSVRALNAGQALIVLEAVLLALTLPRSSAPALGVPPLAMALAGLSLVFLSIERTVWVATIATILVLASWRGSASPVTGASRARRVAFLAAVAVALLVAIGPVDLNASLERATTSAASEQGTFGWRVEGWRILLDRQADRPIYDRAFGNPSGTSYRRVVQNQETVVIPHSMYVSLLLTAGVVGLAVFLSTLGYALFGLRRLAQRAGPDRDLHVALFVLLVAQLVFSISYSLWMFDGIMLGLALGCVREGARLNDRVTLPVAGRRALSGDA